MTQSTVETRRYVLIDENRYGWWTQWAYVDDNKVRPYDGTSHFSLEEICKCADGDYTEFRRTFYKYH